MGLAGGVRKRTHTVHPVLGWTELIPLPVSGRRDNSREHDVALLKKDLLHAKPTNAEPAKTMAIDVF